MSTTHRSYIHKEAGESSLRCTCGNWRGRNLVDLEGHQAHLLAAHPTDTCPDYQNEPEGAVNAE